MCIILNLFYIKMDVKNLKLIIILIILPVVNTMICHTLNAEYSISQDSGITYIVNPLNLKKDFY